MSWAQPAAWAKPRGVALNEVRDVDAVLRTVAEEFLDFVTALIPSMTPISVISASLRSSIAYSRTGLFASGTSFFDPV